jgi:hypothetical protein
VRGSTFFWRVLVGGAALAVALAAAPAVAAEGGQIGESPWFPFVDVQKGAAETYDLNTLDIIRTGDEGWRANRGKYRSGLSRHDFYVTVGRTDLARREVSAAATSHALLWFGCAGVVVGGLLIYAHVSPGGFNPSLDTGLIVAGAGLGTAYLSTFFNGPSVSQDEAAEMTQRYNERLKAHIEEQSGEQRTKPVQASAPRVLPWTDGHSGGGLLALVAF